MSKIFIFLDKLNNHQISDWVSVLLSFLALIAVIFIGIRQNSINEKLTNLEDSVEIFAYLLKNNSSQLFNNDKVLVLRITNVGKVQIYLNSYSINDGPENSIPAFLIPAGQQQNAWYDLLIPISDINPEKETEICLNFEDQMYRKWRSCTILIKEKYGFGTHVGRIKELY